MPTKEPMFGLLNTNCLEHAAHGNLLQHEPLQEPQRDTCLSWVFAGRPTGNKVSGNQPHPCSTEQCSPQEGKIKTKHMKKTSSFCLTRLFQYSCRTFSPQRLPSLSPQHTDSIDEWHAAHCTSRCVGNVGQGDQDRPYTVMEMPHILQTRP